MIGALHIPPHPAPTVAERKFSEKERRRRHILRSAETVFMRLGFHETTIEKIANEAALGKGTVYYYYDNKEAILADLMADLMERARRSIARSLRGVESFRDVLGILGERSLDLFIEHLGFWHVIQKEHGRFHEKCPVQNGRLMKASLATRALAIRLLRFHMRREGLAEDPEIIYDLVSSTVIGYAHHHATTKMNKASLHEKLKRGLDIVTRGLGMSVARK